MENQEQHNKLIAVMLTVFVLTIIVTTVTAIMFLTEKNKLVKQNKIANDIIRNYNNAGSKNITSKKTSIVDDATANGESEDVLSDVELTQEREAYLERKAARKAQLELINSQEEREDIVSEIPETEENFESETNPGEEL